ncbi:hypothetical protein MSAN_02405000 [Mycena sanguinolenta]|uniref:1,3-beta-glucanosyltransferase n=1 Tax=Mycena sanguinolenta TaxID=230812 RepID=A0A8H6X3Q5_9AGAR|nr:hypothetical protein MSAN_02405000 [Mycena sanguinolenta]
MHLWYLLGIIFLNARAVRGLGVIVPLRLDPGTDCAAWDAVSTAITVHPNLHFYIVINPDINPEAGDSLPNASYLACIPNLRPSTPSNAIIMGYVDTATSTSVVPYIDAYAAWNGSYHLDGIMLDHVSATVSLIGTYTSYVSHARSAGFTFIGLDPAAAADESYFPLVDLINTYEYLYSAFDVSLLSDNTSTPLSKQSVVLTNAPTNDSYSTVLSELENLAVCAVYITDKGDTDSALPSQWSALVSELGTITPGAVSASSNGGASQTGSSTPVSSGSNAQTTSALPSRKTKSRLGEIIGPILGLLFLLMGALLFCVRMRRRRRRLDLSASESMWELGPNSVVPAPFEDDRGTRYSSGTRRPSMSLQEARTATATAHRESHGFPPFPPPSYSDVDTQDHTLARSN